MIQPEVMVPPLLWLVTDAAKITGRRFLGVHWDAALPPEQAAEKGGGAGGLDEHCDDANYAKSGPRQQAKKRTRFLRFGS
jgi:hypothetical protein